MGESGCVCEPCAVVKEERGASEGKVKETREGKKGKAESGTVFVVSRHQSSATNTHKHTYCNISTQQGFIVLP